MHSTAPLFEALRRFVERDETIADDTTEYDRERERSRAADQTDNRRFPKGMSCRRRVGAYQCAHDGRIEANDRRCV